MHEIGVLEGSKANLLSFWLGPEIEDVFLGLPIDGMLPVVGRCISKNCFVGWPLSAEADSSVRVFAKVPDDTLDACEVSFPWLSLEPTEAGYRGCNVKTTKSDRPLQSSNEQHVVCALSFC